MRKVLGLIFSAFVFSAIAEDATFLGQKVVTESQILWGAGVGSPTLYISGATGFMRDSAGTRKVLDTTANSVGGAGACSQTIVMRTSLGIVPQSHAELSYKVRATDTAQAGFRIYLATRYRSAPVTSDTGWAVAGRQYVYDSSQVFLTHTNPGATTSFTTRFVNFWLSGQDVRVCIERTSISPGAGDTLVFNNNWLRAW